MTNDGNSPQISPPPPGGVINPSAVTVDQASRLLSAAGRAVSVEMVQATVDADALVGADGKINLVEMLAFLEKNVDPRK
jgi:hypothetical protein